MFLRQHTAVDGKLIKYCFRYSDWYYWSDLNTSECFNGKCIWSMHEDLLWFCGLMKMNSLQWLMNITEFYRHVVSNGA